LGIARNKVDSAVIYRIMQWNPNSPEYYFQKYMENRTKYILGQDNSCHWYLLPADKKEEWEEWLDISEEDERSWTLPEFAKFIDGWHKLSFENPVEE
jgi:hypothetical protein